MITKSANDAATVMAEALGGSESVFAAMMTRKAHELGMANTVFVNASGLPDMRQITTARDLLRLSMALYRDHPAEFRLFATREFVFRGRVVRGHNHLMDRYAGMDGIKTGYTDASGFNLASTAVRNNHRLFAVVMGGRSAAVRDNLMATLLNNSFANRPTSPILVAEAAGISPRHARTLLASLNPIGSADAAELDAEPHFGRHHRHGHIEAASAAGARWAVQVGNFRDRDRARHASQTALRVAHLGGHGARILPTHYLGHRSYSARVVNLSEREALSACRDLHRRHMDCQVVSPERGIRFAS
jgi:D-alanyl-D-alanine carboxypeptidase/D-alanyl-D-alanine carboxypeptidase (penicillin-binding protein 5/6)